MINVSDVLQRMNSGEYDREADEYVEKFDIIGVTSNGWCNVPFPRKIGYNKDTDHMGRHDWIERRFPLELNIPYKGTKYNNKFECITIRYKPTELSDEETIKEILGMITVVFSVSTLGYLNVTLYIDTKNGLGRIDKFCDIKNVGRGVLKRILKGFRLSNFSKDNIERVITDRRVTNANADILLKFMREKFNLTTDDCMTISLLREIGGVKNE